MTDVIDQPESSELPAKLGSKLLEHARQSILDRFGLGESPTDSVLNE